MSSIFILINLSYFRPTFLVIIPVSWFWFLDDLMVLIVSLNPLNFLLYHSNHSDTLSVQRILILIDNLYFNHILPDTVLVRLFLLIYFLVHPCFNKISPCLLYLSNFKRLIRIFCVCHNFSGPTEMVFTPIGFITFVIYYRSVILWRLVP